MTPEAKARQTIDARLPPNARDVSDIGHWGTGDMEIALATQAGFDAVKPLITMACKGR